MRHKGTFEVVENVLCHDSCIHLSKFICLLKCMGLTVCKLYLNKFGVFLNAFKTFHKNHILLKTELPDNCLSIQGHT